MASTMCVACAFCAHTQTGTGETHLHSPLPTIAGAAVAAQAGSARSIQAAGSPALMRLAR